MHAIDDCAGTDNFVEFYLLLSMDGQLVKPQTPSQWHLQDDVRNALNTYAKEFAESICTYILAAGLGEARYASQMADVYIEEVNINNSNRDYAYQHTTIYNRIELAKSLTWVFFSTWHTSSYGGKNWGECTQTALQYLLGKLNPISFIDRAADLHHNGGTLFSKYTQYFKMNGYDKLIRFLDYKFRSVNFVQDYCEGKFTHQVKLTSTTAQLINQFATLVLGLQSPELHGNHPIEPFMFYHPTWGNKCLTLHAKHDKNTHPHKHHYNRETCPNCGDCRPCNYQTWDGIDICEDCAMNATSCDSCGNAIIDDNEVYYYRDNYYCPDCRPSLFTCCICGDKHSRKDKYETWNSRYACYSCAEQTPVCDGCGYLVDDYSVTNTEDGYIYCPDCARKHTITCHACSNIYSRYNCYERLHDGYICDDCKRSDDYAPCPICNRIDYLHRHVDIFYGVELICDDCAMKAQIAANKQIPLPELNQLTWLDELLSNTEPTQPLADDEIPQWLKDLTD